MGKLLGRLWVGGTVLLISFIGFTSQLWVILPSYPEGLRDSNLLKLLAPFNVLLALLYWNYYLTVTTNPGTVPKGWEPDWREIETGQAEVKKLTGTARFCRTCQAYKPPRAHHCRQCRTCVLKMDHHCPWVNNCVGHHNYGHFVRFLFYVDIACSYHLFMITKRAFGVTVFQRAPTTFQIVMLILNYTACVPVLLIVGIFSLFHFWTALTNTTTIEGWEKDKVASLKRRGKIRQYRYPYHLGYWNNLKDVLGPNPWSWWFPQSAPGNGLTYKVGTGIDPHEQLLWPPRDEFVKPRQKRPTKPTGSPFTYGTGLNPLLTGEPRSAQTELRQRIQSTERPPSSNSSATSSSRSSSPSVELSDFEDRDEDDVPLGSLMKRRRRNQTESGTTHLDGDGDGDGDGDEVSEDEEDIDPERAVRIRRGSEGYEIKPRFYQPQPAPSRIDDREEDWEALEREEELEGDPYAEEMVSEGELDQEGNRIRRGQRYKYYVREEDSESDTEDEREITMQ
ncbi:DHHC family palmitoyltransferase [Sporobolomyces koalae]|uniref:DHHC family palmitoyltransferase n=1 Tax=Sporobolomyces koalae TaxID=500713 RepID=UPI00317CDDCD